MAKNTATQSKATHVFEQIDPEDDEANFSDLGASIETDLVSLSSSIRDHVYENGRRYHSMSAGKYLLPNDETEQDRLDMFHHVTTMMLGGKLHLVKLPPKLDRVLDLGTGTRIWAIDMADEHPEAHVIGVDLSPIQPGWVPPNCTFEVDDVEKPWMWKEPFDFIHSANVEQGIHDWPAYVKRIFDNLTPGGVVQLQEVRALVESDDNSIPKGGAHELHVNRYLEAAEVAGLEDVAPELESYLLNAGFVDVRVVIKKLPLAPWPKDPRKKELGRWGMVIMQEGIKSYCLALFTKVLGLSLDDVVKCSDEAFAELRRRDVHSYVAQWFVEGRKPET